MGAYLGRLVSGEELEHGVAVWSSETWIRRATSWVDDRLAEAGLERTGEPEERSMRPWAAVFRVPASGGPVWLKATGPQARFEVGLYGLLQSVAPDRVLTPLGVSMERAWLLLPDGGPSFGDRLEGPPLVAALGEALPAYARLQRDLIPHAQDLLELGVSDMRPGIMPSRFDEAVDAVGAYVERRGETSERAQLRDVVGMRETVAGWCDRLAVSAVQPSLDHNDLHAWNILGDPADPRFYDWGDGVLAHPFASMLALGWVPMSDSTRTRRRDAYLGPFGDMAPHDELVESLELACRVGKIARALTWHRSVSAFSPDEVEERWLSGPSESLFSLLEDSWLGRA
jgi:Phosphotransferase enzyme family